MIDWFSIYYDLHGRSSFGICTQMTGLCKKQNIEVIIYKVLQISFHFELYIRKVTYLFLVHLYLKQFVHGRTETTRTVSMESQAFLQAMGSTSMAKIDDYETTKHKKLHLLRRAAESHQKYTKSARHLFGLSQVLNEDELIPELSKIVSAFNRSKHR